LKPSDHFEDGSPNPARTSPLDPPTFDSEFGSRNGASDSNSSRADEVNETTGSGSSSGLIQSLFGFVEDILGSVNGLKAVYADRIRLSVRRTIVQAILGAGVAVCAVVWLGAAALATFRGMCGGFTALSDGREWLGDLTGGLFALALAALAGWLYLRLDARRELSRLRTKYERIRNAHATNDDTAATADDGGSIARSRRSAGDPEDRGLGAALG
jgi:hypothetical protein